MQVTPHLIIGLTGGIGSGKTTVSNKFEQLGAKVIDADVIARQVVAPKSVALNAIIDKFGPAIVLEDGNLNRAKLRGIVFQSDTDKKWLNELMHPLIRTGIEQAINAPCDNYVLLVAPLLLENQLDKLVHRVLVIDTTEALQVARAASRDTREADEIRAIMASQISRDHRLAKAHDIIDNTSDNPQHLDNAVKQLHQKYLHLSIQHKQSIR